VFEAVGFTVVWDGSTQTATLRNDDYEIIIIIGSNLFTTNGEEFTLDVPAQTINGRTMLPIRLVLESAGMWMEWFSSTRTVGIFTKEFDRGGQHQEPEQENQFEENLARFNMSLQYSSDNFNFYSTDNNSKWLPEMARKLEDKLSGLIEAFGFNPHHKMPVFYYDFDDFNTAFSSWFGVLSRDYYPGLGGKDGIAVRGEFNHAAPTDSMMIPLLAHEAVHVIQDMMFDLGSMPSWVYEGTANFLAGNNKNALPLIVEAVRNNRIPTLDSLEAPGINSVGHPNYFIFVAAAETLIHFVAETFGMEKVLQLHENFGDYQRIFGISRAEFESQWNRFLREHYR